MDWPTMQELLRIVPVASLTCALIYFGWWLRGESVRILKQQLDKK